MSVPFRVEDAVDWISGNLVQGNQTSKLSGVSTDTRNLSAGQLFVAIAGPNHDAHDYLEGAVGAGAGGLMVQRGREPSGAWLADLPVISVEDTTRGLGALAHGHRKQFDGPVIAITGSNGKTTTKEICASVLAVGAPTHKNRGNLNNHYGLPLTLLAREPEHRRMVVELGMNHRGEIAELAAIAEPTIGIVTNVGTAHIEHLASRDEIALEKGDLLAAIDPHGTAVVNRDDDYAKDLASRTRGSVLFFGRGPGADVTAEEVRGSGHGFAFTLRAPQGRVDVKISGLGETTVINALAAAAGALAAGASLDDLAAGLAGYKGISGRLERRELPGNVVIIDDSYNANPQSMEIALRLLASCQDARRRIAVIGDMGELGDETEQAHVAVGRLAAELGIEFVVTVGENAERVADGARAGGLTSERIRISPDSDAAGETVQGLLHKGDWVLVKGSRTTRMERITRYLETEAAN